MEKLQKYKHSRQFLGILASENVRNIFSETRIIYIISLGNQPTTFFPLMRLTDKRFK